MTSSNRSGSMPVRLSDSVTTASARSKAVVFLSVPFLAVPIAVRHAETITASGIYGSSGRAGDDSIESSFILSKLVCTSKQGYFTSGKRGRVLHGGADRTGDRGGHRK